MIWFLGYLAIGGALLCGFLVADSLSGEREPLRSIWQACLVVLFVWPWALWMFLSEERDV